MHGCDCSTVGLLSGRWTIPHYSYLKRKNVWVSKHKQPHIHPPLPGYYGLSLFNSCSLTTPDNDKAPQPLTASLLTLSLLSLSAYRSLPSWCRFVSIVWHSRTIWRHHEPPLKRPYSSYAKTCERGRNANANCAGKDLQRPQNRRYRFPLTGGVF